MNDKIVYLMRGLPSCGKTFKARQLAANGGLICETDEYFHTQIGDDPTKYNTVQKLLYVGVLAAGVMIVISGLAIWKPIQFSELLALFGSFQNARLVHFLCMTAIVGFMVVHITLALLVPHTLVAMVTGGPEIAAKPQPLPQPQLESTR